MHGPGDADLVPSIQTERVPAYDVRIMFEVYTGTKAGRPTVLLLLTAGALVSALGLAWTQVYGSRALGEEVQVEGAPLIVRPPKGWVADRKRPGVFVKWNRELEGVERSIKFAYHRWRVFQPLSYLVRVREFLDRKQAYEPEPGGIGGFEGVQVRRRRVFHYRGRQESGETIYRLISTARGDQISVEYTPLGELSSGDLELFDAVCRSVVLDDPCMRTKPEEALGQAGLRFGISESWEIIGPDFPEIAGLYVQNNEGGIPVWGLGVFRTWLAPGRSPNDLLASFALQIWRQPAQALAARQWTRSDGATIAMLTNPTYEQRRGQITSAWVLAKSPAEATVIYVLADDSTASAADQAAAQLAEEMQFVSSYPADGVEAAVANGRELAGLLRTEGAASWWGAGEVTSYYYGEIAGSQLLVVSQRRTVDDTRGSGYEGSDQYLGRDPGAYENHVWGIDAGLEAFARRVETDFDGRSLRLQEARKAGESTVHRIVKTAEGFEESSVAVGAAFVPPQAETLAESWVAKQEGGTWLTENSPLSGTAMTTQLSTPLEPDAEGRVRVLLVDDYWPRGSVLAFDADLELAYQIVPGGRFERVTAEQAERVKRMFGRR